METFFNKRIIEMKIKKKIYLVGFRINQISEIKKKFKEADFIFEKRITNKYNSCDGIVGITRISLEEVLKRINFKKNKKIKWIHLPGAGVDKYSYLKNFNKLVYTSIRSCNGFIVNSIKKY